MNTLKTPPKNARRYAVWLLSRREWGQAELRARMRQRGLDDAAIEDALVFVQAHDLQSDERFCASRARQLSTRKGDRRIALELGHKGVAEELVARHLSELPDEAQRALDVASRFAGTPSSDKLRAKAYRFLAGRGFGSDAIRGALRSLEADSADGYNGA